MKSTEILLLVLLTICLCTTAAPAQTTQHITQENNISTSHIKLSDVGMVSRGFCGAIYGIMVGIPIRSFSYVRSESRRMTDTLESDLEVQPASISGAMIGVVGTAYGITSGITLGLIKGTEQGLSQGYQKPFSKTSIGLEESSTDSTTVNSY